MTLNADDDEESSGTKKTTANKSGKKGFDTEGRLSLRIDAQEATRYQANKNKGNLDNQITGIKNLRKKVRDSQNEEENGIDTDVIISLNQMQMNLVDASNGDNSLLAALDNADKRNLQQNTVIEIARQEQNAGKMNAILQANKLSEKAGISKINDSEFIEKMQEAIYNPRKLQNKVLEENISKKTGISGKISKNKAEDIVEGVQKIREVAKDRQVKKVDFDDVANIGRKNASKRETAELILRKSGQTARLSEIKMKSAVDDTNGKKDRKPRSYSKKMKQLLEETLRKNDKVQR
ncbi:MAG: hypothetical protein IKO06_00090 [Alphaproteobacteria bacterium]|nr:hypothetical protein [Alphaproteobacteria bacterium]